MKFKVQQWNGFNGERAYGISGQIRKGDKFMNCCEVIQGVRRALIYTERSRADEIVRQLNKGETPDLETGLVPLKNQPVKIV